MAPRKVTARSQSAAAPARKPAKAATARKPVKQAAAVRPAAAKATVATARKTATRKSKPVSAVTERTIHPGVPDSTTMAIAHLRLEAYDLLMAQADDKQPIDEMGVRQRAKGLADWALGRELEKLDETQSGEDV